MLFVLAVVVVPLIYGWECVDHPTTTPASEVEALMDMAPMWNGTDLNWGLECALGRDPCDVDNETPWDGLNCTRSGSSSHIISLCAKTPPPSTLHSILPSRKLSGPLPDALGGLPWLQKLHLAQNYFTSLTPALCFLDHLSVLDLSNQAGKLLAGSIPECFGQMKSLTSVLLSGNALTGSLPWDWGSSALTKLDASSNSLSGFLSPSICSIPSCSLAGGAFYCPVPLNCCNNVSCEWMQLANVRPRAVIAASTQEQGIVVRTKRILLTEDLFVDNCMDCVFTFNHTTRVTRSMRFLLPFDQAEGGGLCVPPPHSFAVSDLSIMFRSIVVSSNSLPFLYYGLPFGATTTAYGAGLLGSGPLLAGDTNVFWLQPRDENDYPPVDSMAVFDTTIKETSKHLQIPSIQLPTINGITRVQYTLFVTGKYSIDVQLQDKLDDPKWRFPIRNGHAERLVVAGPVDARQCTGEGNGLDTATVGVPVEFVVTARDHWSNAQHTGGLLFGVIMSDKQEAAVVDKNNGRYHITYTPLDKGVLTVDVVLNGTSILGSPWAVTVEPPPWPVSIQVIVLIVLASIASVVILSVVGIKWYKQHKASNEESASLLINDEEHNKDEVGITLYSSLAFASKVPKRSRKKDDRGEGEEGGDEGSGGSKLAIRGGRIRGSGDSSSGGGGSLSDSGYAGVPRAGNGMKFKAGRRARRAKKVVHEGYIVHHPSLGNLHDGVDEGT